MGGVDSSFSLLPRNCHSCMHTTAIRCKRGFTATITPALLLISKLHFSHGHEENQRECEGKKKGLDSLLSPCKKEKEK
jgi:hypothetical protein